MQANGRNQSARDHPERVPGDEHAGDDKRRSGKQRRHRQQLCIVGQPKAFRQRDAEENCRDHHGEHVGLPQPAQNQEFDGGGDQPDGRRNQQVARPIRPLPLHDDQEARKRAEHGKRAMREVDGFRRLVDDDKAERRQRIERAKLDARDQNKSQFSEHRDDQGLSITR